MIVELFQTDIIEISFQSNSQNVTLIGATLEVGLP